MFGYPGATEGDSAMRKRVEKLTNVQVGFAVNSSGFGVVYGAVGPARRVLSLSFRAPGLPSRAAAYVALDHLARALRDHKLRNVQFFVPDAELVADLTQQRALAAILIPGYVRLGCTLNQLGTTGVAYWRDPDMEARARADVALGIAA